MWFFDRKSKKFRQLFFVRHLDVISLQKIMFWTQKMPQKILVLLGPFHTPFWGVHFWKKKKIKKKTLASKTTVNPYQKLKNEKIPKIEFVFTKNSATLFCEVSRCHKLAKNYILDPKNDPKNFVTFGSFPYPLLGGPFLKKKKKLKKKH